MNRLEQVLTMLKEEPNDPFLLFAAAIEYVGMNDDETALEYFNKIVETNPAYDGVYYHLGKLYERRNDIEKAKRVYNTGLEITKGKSQKNYNELRAALDEIEFD